MSLALSLPLQRLPRSALFRTLGEVSRLRVLALCAEEELSVSELATLLGDGQPQVSRRVTALREAGLVESRRDGTRTLVRLAEGVAGDAVVSAALAEGREACLADGSLARIPGVLAAREAPGVLHFEAARREATSEVTQAPTHLAHLAALSPLFPQHRLAVDVGAGDGLSLDVLAPLFTRVIAVERSRAQLARLGERVAARGFHHVSLFPGSYDDVALLERVDAMGGADLVFAGRALHHASRPGQAVTAFARLLRRGGHLVVLDYLPHDDDTRRSEGGDVWLGFRPEQLRHLFEGAGLEAVAEVAIPSPWLPPGPDAALRWHAWAARRAPC